MGMGCEEWPVLEEKNCPYYVQIYNVIFRMIQEGTLVSGDCLPGENLLAAHWHVSRSTVRMAVRKLEEDGYLLRTQGRRTTVASAVSGRNHGLQRLFNPCMANCAAPVDRVEAAYRLEENRGYISQRLGYLDTELMLAVIDGAYFSGQAQVASSICIVPLYAAKALGIEPGDKEGLRDVIVRRIYQKARRSRMSLKAMGPEEEEPDVPGSRITLVFEEVLMGEQDEALAYCKYRVNGDWYRFTLDRKAMEPFPEEGSE